MPDIYSDEELDEIISEEIGETSAEESLQSEDGNEAESGEEYEEETDYASDDEDILGEDYVDDLSVDDLGDYEAYADDAEEKESSPAASPEEKALRRKSRRKGLLALLIVILVCAVTGIICIFLFFRVRTISVSGVTKYSINQIVEACGVTSGDNLVFVSRESIEKSLKAAYPYVESVKISREYPSELKIIVTETQPRYSVPYNGMYAYVSSTGKLLEMANAKAMNSIILVGGSISDDGGYLKFDNDNVQKIYTSINEYLNERDTKITEIDISDIYDIEIKYDDRVIFEIGGYSDLRYKLNFGIQIVSGSGIGEDEYGRLDLTLSSDSNKAYFTPTKASDINGESEEISSEKSWTETFSGSGREIDGVDIVESATPDPSLAKETPMPRDETGAIITPEPTEEPTPEPTVGRGDDIPDF